MNVSRKAIVLCGLIRVIDIPILWFVNRYTEFGCQRDVWILAIVYCNSGQKMLFKISELRATKPQTCIVNSCLLYNDAGEISDLSQSQVLNWKSRWVRVIPPATASPWRRDHSWLNSDSSSRHENGCMKCYLENYIKMYSSIEEWKSNESKRNTTRWWDNVMILIEFWL